MEAQDRRQREQLEQAHAEVEQERARLEALEVQKKEDVSVTCVPF